MDLTERKVSGKMVYNGVIVNVRLDQVELSNGNRAPREVVDHPGAVGILPLDAENNVTMVVQFRYAFLEELLEIPAGKLEKGENHREAALRELREETGIVPGELIYLGCTYSSPGFCTEAIHLYLARDLKMGTSSPDEDEFLILDKVPFSELVDKIRRNEVRDSKTVAAVLKTKLLLGL